MYSRSFTSFARSKLPSTRSSRGAGSVGGTFSSWRCGASGARFSRSGSSRGSLAADAPASRLTGTRVAPLVGERDVTFRLDDRDRQIQSVSLLQELRRPRVGPSFERDAAGSWSLMIERPEVDRMEYRFEVTDVVGLTEAICDPHNPRRAPGPFGDKSVIEWPEYRPPRWLDVDGLAGAITETEVRSPSLGTAVPIRLWAAEETQPTEELPLLVVHDGMDYERYAALTVLLAGLVKDGGVAPLRAALLTPVQRNRWYGASPLYARALAEEVLPELARVAPAPPGVPRIGMGASLGALAMLHAQRQLSGSFGALFLQSGCFFM